jgi:hypothetical protein
MGLGTRPDRRPKQQVDRLNHPSGRLLAPRAPFWAARAPATLKERPGARPHTTLTHLGKPTRSI